MAFHHVALATNDLTATHDFYTGAMGFELIKAVVAPTDQPPGWAKHLFYATGEATGETGAAGGMIAFWELHDERIGSFDPRISDGLGLPAWVNHLAFDAGDLDGIAARRRGWLDRGIDVLEVDHGFCVSIYTLDPNAILVEWCADVAPYTAADKAAALVALRDPSPALEDAPRPKLHRAAAPARTEAAPVDVPVPAT